GDRVQRSPRSRPVADLHRIVRFDLVDVEDLVSIREAETGVLTELRDEIDEEGPSGRDQAAFRRDAGRQRGDAGADAPAGALEALDRGDVLKGREEARDGRLREPDALGDVGDARRPLRHLVEDRERALERLHHGLRSPRIPPYSTVPHYGTRERG